MAGANRKPAMNASPQAAGTVPTPASSKRILRYHGTSLFLGVAFTVWAYWQHFRWGQGHASGGSFAILFTAVFLILGAILVWGVFERFDKFSRPFLLAAQSVACLLLGAFLTHRQMKAAALQGFRVQLSEVCTPKKCREWAESYHQRATSGAYPDWDDESNHVRKQILPLRRRAYPFLNIENLGNSNTAVVNIVWPAGYRDWRLTCAVNLAKDDSDEFLFDALNREDGDWAAPVRWGSPQDHIFLTLRRSGK